MLRPLFLTHRCSVFFRSRLACQVANNETSCFTRKSLRHSYWPRLRLHAGISLVQTRQDPQDYYRFSEARKHLANLHSDADTALVTSLKNSQYVEENMPNITQHLTSASIAEPAKEKGNTVYIKLFWPSSK